MSLLYYGDIVPHLEQCRREGGGGEEEKEEVVECVEETDLPMKEEVEVLEREGEGKEKDEDCVDTEKPTAAKSGVEGSMEVKLLPLQPLLQEWDVPVGQYGEQEYELMGFMADQESLFPNIPVLTSALPTGDSFLDPLLLPPVGMATTTPTIIPSDLKPVSMPPSLMAVDTPISTATLLPLFPKVNKPKKKLTKHHVKSHKYAPGDYTEVPVIRTGQESTDAAASSANPYRSFLISSTVDHRLQHSLELPSELAMQLIVKAQFGGVMRSLVTATPARPLEETGKEGDGEGWKQREEGLEEVCRFVRGSLNQLLMSLTSSQEVVDLVRFLQLWNELNALLPPPPPSGGPSGGSTSEKFSSNFRTPTIRRRVTV